MSDRATMFGFAAAAVAAGVCYVVVHEARRKRKKAEKLAREAPISKELLLQILNKSAEASKAVIDRIRVEVRKVQQQRNLSDEDTHRLFQQNFEHSLDQLIGAIRNQHRVSEKAMDSSFKQHQADPEVRAAIQNMRLLSGAAPTAPQPAATAQPAGSSGAGSSASAGTPTGLSIPASLTRDKLRDVMTFNAVTLEKELKPLRKQMEEIRKKQPNAQMNPQVLAEVQKKISEAVLQKYQVTDEQVMAAVEIYEAREDPAFKDILQRIATTFNEALQ